MKRIFTACLVLASAIVLLCSCGKKASSIVLSTSEVEIEINASYQMVAYMLPDNVIADNLLWKSTDETIAIVNDSGLITGVSEGSTNIIATGNGGEYAVCAVSVKKQSAYDRLSNKEREFVDVVLKAVNSFYNPSSVTIKYAYYHDVTDRWSISVSAQNKMGGYSEVDYDLDRDGTLIDPFFKHVRTGLDSGYNLDLVNEAIRERVG